MHEINVECFLSHFHSCEEIQFVIRCLEIDPFFTENMGAILSFLVYIVL